MDTIDESVMKGVKKLANLLGKTEDDILALINKKKEEMGGLINDYGALSGVANDFGIRISELTDEENITFSKIKDVLTKKEISVNVIGRVKRKLPVKEFSRKDGTTGKVGRIIIADETGEIPVVLWDAHSEILKWVKFNDIIRILKGNTRVSSFGDVEKVEINLTSFSFIDVNPKVSVNIPEISEHIYTLKEIKETVKDDKLPVCVIGRIISEIEIDEFERVDKSKGVRSSFYIEDETGTMRVVVWDNLNEKNKDINFGSIVKIRGVAKKSIFENVEISTNSAENIEKSDVDLNLPELKKPSTELLKIGEISEKYNTLNEDERKIFNVATKGIVTKNFGVKEFEDVEGGKGKRGAIFLSDDTGTIRVVFWNEAADFINEINEGDAIEIKKGRVKENMNAIEIHLNKKGNVHLIDKKEFANINIPVSTGVVEKKISELIDGDRNVKLVVKIIDILPDQQLTYSACPTCGKKVINIGNEWYCEKCGTTVEPVPRLMLKVIASDIKEDNKQIKVILFGENVEKITNMNVSQILNLVGQLGEKAVIEKIKADIQNNVKIITGNAKFNKNFAEMEFYVNEIK